MGTILFISGLIIGIFIGIAIYIPTMRKQEEEIIELKRLK